MASFPTAKAHRVDRRKLGRGQHIQLPLVTCVVTSAADHATLTFNVPVVVNGSLDLVPVGLVYQGQEQISSTVYQVNYDSAVTGVAYDGIAAGSPIVQSMQGGAFAGIPGGTFS